jgi:hypothetical protein
MTTYRAYLLNTAGKIIRGEWLEAESEEEAALQAKALCEPGAPTVELWRQHLRIGTYRCDLSPPD